LPSNQKNQIFVILAQYPISFTSEWFPTPRLCARAHTSRLQRWLVVGNVWEICSARDLSPIPPSSETELFCHHYWFIAKALNDLLHVYNVLIAVQFC